MGGGLLEKQPLRIERAYFCCRLGNCKDGSAVGGVWKAEGFGGRHTRSVSGTPSWRCH